MLSDQERELIRKIRANDGGKEDERLMKHWKMWEQTYAQDTTQEPKSIQDLIKNIRQLLFKRQVDEMDDLDSFFTNITPPPPEPGRFKFKPWFNFEIPIHKNAFRLAETSAEDEDPEDWVDGFAKHIEVEALLDE